MESLNRWTTVIANFGVIAGILVLAYQINENTQQMKADSLFQHDELVGSWRMNMYSDENLSWLWFEGRKQEVEFTELQTQRYRQLVIDYLQRSRTNYVAATTAGHIGQAEMAATNVAREFSRSSRAREVWKDAGREISLTIDEGFVSAVERNIKEFDQN